MNVHTEYRYWSVAVVMESSDSLVFFLCHALLNPAGQV